MVGEQPEYWKIPEKYVSSIANLLQLCKYPVDGEYNIRSRRHGCDEIIGGITKGKVFVYYSFECITRFEQFEDCMELEELLDINEIDYLSNRNNQAIQKAFSELKERFSRLNSAMECGDDE